MPKQLIFPVTLVLTICCVGILQGATIAEKLENFDTDPGWSSSGNKTASNDYGYLGGNSNLASGLNPGEAGGTFQRTGVFTYYADTDLKGVFDTSVPLKMSGQINVTAAIPDPGSDRNILGYFDKESQIPTMLGIRICDPKNALADWRIRLYSINTSGDKQGSDAGIGAEMMVNGDFNFEWTYDPAQGTNGRMTLMITTVTGSILVGDSDAEASHEEIITYDLPNGHGVSDTRAKFNAFGMGVFQESSRTQTAQIYFDDLRYNVNVPGNASHPGPADGALHDATWVSLSWSPDDLAASHNVYLGDNFEDVNNGIGDTFIGNLNATVQIAGFPGYAFPGGLVPGATYYWRVDEVNESNPNSPWKGDVWSFTTPPKTAYFPEPADGADSVDTNATLNWTAGIGTRLHTVYLSDNYDDVNSTSAGMQVGSANYNPGTLEPEKVYYWRVDESDDTETNKGDIWAFATLGAVSNPQPVNNAGGIQLNTILSWIAADNATSHELYFGTDPDAIKKATPNSPEYVGPRPLGAESYDPTELSLSTSYSWRVDEVYPAGTVKGPVWTFKTADFILVDDFEAYNDIDPLDPQSNTIYSSWIDGYEVPTNGAITAEEFPPYAQLIVVHSGNQSMKYRYDTNFMISESTLTLDYPNDWTGQDVTKLSLWYRGNSANAPERMFIALNGTAAVYHDNPQASRISGWNEWTIELQKFTDQGANLTTINTMTIGFGTKDSADAGGAGTVFFDDIRLTR